MAASGPAGQRIHRQRGVRGKSKSRVVTVDDQALKSQVTVKSGGLPAPGTGARRREGRRRKGVGVGGVKMWAAPIVFSLRPPRCVSTGPVWLRLAERANERERRNKMRNQDRNLSESRFVILFAFWSICSSI